MNEMILKTTENNEIIFYNESTINNDIKAFKIDYDKYFLNKMHINRRFRVKL
ncbi:MAG: hypothetical protein LBT66_00735 [Methanobrevibacter sp.]|jgi:hypothetical protein|nr:hypothetical protein [Candidatus Methanovirga meridionalis]